MIELTNLVLDERPQVHIFLGLQVVVDQRHEEIAEPKDQHKVIYHCEFH